MEWKEILDRLHKNTSQTIYDKNVLAIYECLNSVILKLASEEAKKPEELVFRLAKINNKDWCGYEFKDRYNCICQIQNSSLATESTIWLGKVDERMHLTQDMVKALLPLLQEFVDKGEIS